MPEISVIVFDLGNVLIPFDYKPMIAKFNEIENEMGDNFARLYRENYHIHRAYEKSELSTEEFLRIMMKWTNDKMSRGEFCRYFSDIFSLNQNVIDLLPRLKENYSLILLSNTNEIHKNYGYIHNGFLKNFDRLFLSHEVGSVKPEEKIYRAVENFTEAPSAEHLFIDDIEDYVNGAKRLGWSGIQFTSYENLLSEFDKLGIKY